MRILIIGSSEQNAIEEFYVRYLTELNIKVQLLPAQSLFYRYYSRSFFHKVYFKLGWSSIYRKINRLILSEARLFQPDFVWVFKGMEVYPETLKQLSKMGVKLVNYNPDNPFLFSGAGSGNENITNSIHFYDIHFTYNLEIKKQLEGKTKGCVYVLPFGFDIPSSVVMKVQTKEEIKRVCFLGNPDKERADFIRQLAEKGLGIDVYGNKWSEFIHHSMVTAYPAVYNMDQWEVLYRYRVQLNIMRRHNLSSHNMRTFEVPAIGGIMLAPETKEHTSFFEDGKEAFFYKNADDCFEIAEKLLRLPLEEATMVRKLARKRSLESGYSYKDRATFVAQILSRS